MFGLLRRLFAQPSELGLSGARVQCGSKSYNLAKVACPMCGEDYTMHGMRRHWQCTHNALYHKSKDYYDSWYKQAKVETEGTA